MILNGTENTSDVIKLPRDHSEGRKFFARGNTDNFLIHLQMPLGSVIGIQIGHDTYGDDSSWFLEEILVVDIQSGDQWIFNCHRWLALERDDGSTTRAFYTDDNKGSEEFKRSFGALRKNGFADDHLWLSVISKQPRNTFTRVQRASCCWCFLLLSMITSAMFYGTESPKQQKINIGPFTFTLSQLVIAVETAVIVLPVSLLIVFLFRRSEPRIPSLGRRYYHTKRQTKTQYLLPHFCIYIAWFLCVSAAITSAVFTVLYSLAWGSEKSARWLTSVLLSITGDVVVSQPIKIILVSVVLALRCGCFRKSKAEDKPVEKHNLEVLQDDLSPVYVDVERAKKYKINERKMYRYMKELFFTLLFFFLLLIVCYGDKNQQRYDLKEATDNDFQFFDDKVSLNLLRNESAFDVTCLADFTAIKINFNYQLYSDPGHRLNGLLPPRNEPKYNLRNHRPFALPGLKTNRTKNTFIFSMARQCHI